VQNSRRCSPPTADNQLIRVGTPMTMMAKHRRKNSDVTLIGGSMIGRMPPVFHGTPDL
jgi:hypothetical protein